jgi:hypothetical protein
MQRTPQIVSVVLIIYGSWICFPSCAYGYIDPGTGSFLLQLLIGFVLGGIFAMKVFWGKVTAFLARIFKGKISGGDGKQ